jgi:penicillin-binding protein 2
MTLLQFPKFSRQKTARTIGRNYQSLVIMVIITLFLGAGLASRLVYLQLVEGKHNRKLAEGNRIRVIPKLPERGNVFDRNGKTLATSRLSHAVFVWPMAHTKPEWPTVVKRLSQILNMPEEEILKRVQKAGAYSPTLVRIARGLTPAQITALAEYKNELSGTEVQIESIRHYPNGEFASHVIGYTGELNDEELADKRDEGYRLGDVIGQLGVEAAFEKTLRGEWGGQQVEVDGTGKIKRVLGQKQARAGNNVKLTIDLELQKAAEKALGDFQGSIIAMDPNNGSILAMASRPNYDPNIFSRRMTSKEWKSLQSKDHPFVNRALRGFPPASTFKIVTNAAGIESGKYSPSTVLQTYPSLTVGGVTFGEWNHAGFGPLGFVGAMAMSSDTFFYQIGRGIGGPKLIEWTRKFGFGQKTGIELADEESKGLVPDDAWKRQRMNIPWSVGDTINMSIGQGFLLSTPLQVAVMFAVPANGGYRVQPHLLRDNEEAKSWRESLNMKPETIKILRQGLRRVMTDGTAQALNVPTLPPFAGKTGTAEAWRKGVKRNHAWFGAYAPFDKPEIVVVAFAEHAGEGGGKVAAPMVVKVLEDYFHRKYPNKYQKPKAEKKVENNNPTD